MKRVFLFCLAFCLCSCSYESPNMFYGNNGERLMHVSLVKKSAFSPNQKVFSRVVADRKHYVLVTSDLVPECQQTVIIREPVGHRLHLVTPLSEELLAGELVRFGRIAVISHLDNPENATSIFNSSEYIYLDSVPAVESESLEATTDQLELDDLEDSDAGNNFFVEIDPDQLKKALEEFSGEKPYLLNGTEVRIEERGTTGGRVLARGYLTQEFKKLGYEVSTHVYNKGKIRNADTGENIIIEKAGADPSKFILLTAHYDTVGSPGADDNGSGIITLIAMAKVLKSTKPKYTIRFVAFDEEEDGMTGSKAYAKHLKNTHQIDSLVAVINLDMTGYEANNDNHMVTVDCEENSSPELTTMVVNTIAKYQMKLKRLEYCNPGSDHSSFWNYNKPSIAVSEDVDNDFNPCYHKGCDQVNKINFKFMAEIATLVTKTVADYFTITK